MASNRDHVNKWIDKGKHRYALAAIVIESKLALLATVVIAIVVLALTLGPAFAAVGASIISTIGALRWLRGT